MMKKILAVAALVAASSAFAGAAPEYYCKYCGAHFVVLQSLLRSRCTVNWAGNTNHVLYEGGKKSFYTCKFCGMRFVTIGSMGRSRCNHNPVRGGNHEPML